MAKEKIRKTKTRVKKNQKLYKDAVITESYAIYRGIILILIFSLLANIFVIYHFFTFNHNKIKIKTKVKTEIQEKVSENIVFLGDSITNRYDLEKYFPNTHVVNSGREGNKTEDVLDDMKERVYNYNPSKVFLLIGTNDLDGGEDTNEIATDIEKIVVQIMENRPDAEIYVESVYPVNDDVTPSRTANRENSEIDKMNTKIKEICEKKKVTYIDVNTPLKDEDGKFREEYTKDGLHLTDLGYEKVTDILKKYVK